MKSTDSWMNGKTLSQIKAGVGRPEPTEWVPDPADPPLVQSARKALKESSYQFVRAVGGALVDDETAAAADAAIPQITADGESSEAPEFPTATVMLDMTTAGMLVEVYDALSPANQAHFARTAAKASVERFVTMCWQVVEKAKGGK